MKLAARSEIVKINSRKFDGSVHRSWNAELIERQGEQMIFVGEFEEEIKHPHLGVIRRGTISYEFYWLNRGYNVFRFHEPEGDLRNFYCNLNAPPTFKNGVLDYVDLDIDVVVWKDFSVQILDADEYEENACVFDYSAKLRETVNVNLSELLALIERREFPFDYKF